MRSITKNKMLARLIALAAPLAVAACGGSEPPGVATTVEGNFIRAAQTWDLNHDGVVTCEEWRSYALSVFKEADVNHDGKLTPQEFAKLQKIDSLFERADFKYYDTAGHGFVTMDEFVNHPNPAFQILDKENTCRLTMNQLRVATTPRTSDNTDDHKPMNDKK